MCKARDDMGIRGSCGDDIGEVAGDKWKCTFCEKEAWVRYVCKEGGVRPVNSEVKLCNDCVDQYEIDKRFKCI